MLARVREVEGGYKVTLQSAEGEIGSRETTDLAEAFAWQAAGGFPSDEPETKDKGK